MERQKEAFEARYATKMGKILTKLSKETDKARVHAASTKSSPFQVSAYNRRKRPAVPVPVGPFHTRKIFEVFRSPEILHTTLCFVQHIEPLTRVANI